MSNLTELNPFAAYQQNFFASLLNQTQQQSINGSLEYGMYNPDLVASLIQHQQQQIQNNSLSNAFQSLQNSNRDYLLTSAFASLHQQQMFLKNLSNSGVDIKALMVANKLAESSETGGAKESKRATATTTADQNYCRNDAGQSEIENPVETNGETNEVQNLSMNNKDKHSDGNLSPSNSSSSDQSK